MNERDLFRAIGNVDEDLIEEAGQPIKRRSARSYLSVAVAACLCLAALFLAVKVLPGTRKSSDAAGEKLMHGQEAPLSNGGYVAPGDPGKIELNEEDLGRTETEIIFDPTIAPLSEPPADNNSTSGSGVTTDSYGTASQDFRFILTWDGQTYDSASDQITAGSQSYSLLLAPDQLEEIWKLLSGLEITGERTEGDILLEVTYDGQTYRTAVMEDDYGAALSICTEVIRILEGAPGWRVLS